MHTQILAVLAAALLAAQCRAGWHKDFEESFDRSALRTERWSARNFSYGLQRQLQFYSPDDCYVEKGHLVLRSRRRELYGAQYTSCWVDSQAKQAFRYGRFEVRAKLPADLGIHAAHWLLPSDLSCWPAHGEIDVMENDGWKTSQYAGTVHWDPEGYDACTLQYASCTTGTFDTGVDLSDDYHTYGIIWTERNLTWTFDGAEVKSCGSGGVLGVTLPPVSMYWILSSAIMSESTSFPQYHYIDWVRHYSWGSGSTLPVSAALLLLCLAARAAL
eukprot:m51a1_g4769 putative glucan endo- -beta-d-glucosidase (273) ;mRNA; r:17610-18746